MAEEEAAEGGEEAAGEEKKGLPIKLILIVVGVLVLGGGGYFAYTNFFQEETVEESAEQSKEGEESEEQERLAKMIEKVTEGAFTSIAVEFTNTPKHEVSYGLLVSKEGATDLNVNERSHETVLGEDVLMGKSKIGIVSDLDPEKDWRIKDISQLKSFLKYLQAFSKIPVKLTKKFEGDLEGKINAELKNGQSRALEAQKNQQSVEGDDSMQELQKTTSILEPVFIQGLKQVIKEVTSGKLKLK